MRGLCRGVVAPRSPRLTPQRSDPWRLRRLGAPWQAQRVGGRDAQRVDVRGGRHGQASSLRTWATTGLGTATRAARAPTSRRATSSSAPAAAARTKGRTSRRARRPGGSEARGWTSPGYPSAAPAALARARSLAMFDLTCAFRILRARRASGSRRAAHDALRRLIALTSHLFSGPVLALAPPVTLRSVRTDGKRGRAFATARQNSGR